MAPRGKKKAVGTAAKTAGKKKTKRGHDSDGVTLSTKETRNEGENAKRRKQEKRHDDIITFEDGYRVHKGDYDVANSIFQIDGIGRRFRDVRRTFEVAKEDPHCRISTIAMPRSIPILPKSLLYLDALEELVLKATTDIPDWISEFRQLRKISMDFSKYDFHEMIKAPDNDKFFDRLPNSICNITNLTEMKIRVDHIPEEIGMLTNLQTLEAMNDTKSLPRSVGNLKNLRVLNLSWCSHLKILPAEIGDLTSLETLNLSKCGLEILPAEIGHLTSLETLNLSDCGLTILPVEIGDLTRLETLNLSKCSCLGSLPRSIGNLKNLKVLNLSNTLDLNELPDEIGNLTSLSELNLSQSRIYLLPLSIGNLKNLKVLNLGDNEDLMYLPDQMWTLANLEHLNMSNIGFASIIDEDDDDDVDENDDDDENDDENDENEDDENEDDDEDDEDYEDDENEDDDEDYEDYKNEYDDEDYEDYENEDDDEDNEDNENEDDENKDDEEEFNEFFQSTFGKLKNLQFLDLSDNELITSLPESIGNLTTLKCLNLSYLDIASFPDSFGNLTGLKRLDLNGMGKLKALPKCIENFTNLEELRCDSMPVHGVPSVLRNLKNLRYLSLCDSHDEPVVAGSVEDEGSLMNLVRQNPQLPCLGCDFDKLCKDLHGALAHNRAKMRLFGAPGHQGSSPRPAVWPLIFARAPSAFKRHHKCEHHCYSRIFRSDSSDRFGRLHWDDSDCIFQLLVRYGADVVDSRRPLLTSYVSEACSEKWTCSIQ